MFEGDATVVEREDAHGDIRAVFLPDKHFTAFAALWAAPHTPHTPDE